MRLFCLIVSMLVLVGGCRTTTVENSTPKFPASNTTSTFEFAYDPYYKQPATNLTVTIVRKFDINDFLFAWRCAEFCNHITTNSAVKFYPDLNKYYMAKFSGGFVARAMTDGTNVYVSTLIVPEDNNSYNNLVDKMSYGITIAHEWAHLGFGWKHDRIEPEWEIPVAKGYDKTLSEKDPNGGWKLFSIAAEVGVSDLP
jgi:hypothetical protein